MKKNTSPIKYGAASLILAVFIFVSPHIARFFYFPPILLLMIIITLVVASLGIKNGLQIIGSSNQTALVVIGAIVSTIVFLVVGYFLVVMVIYG